MMSTALGGDWSKCPWALTIDVAGSSRAEEQLASCVTRFMQSGKRLSFNIYE